ncbi:MULTISPECIES: lysophospholipid acyltransferase family protein [Acidithiobacillus]|jgi:1-acyl-sn-glycerol-3-phosphate acyltransferase|uniref:lysophospholipid acyltransferase family protein n=1 Tax=Acidithiobacillus TaxID=119977 RepID=UPI000AE92950|nr:MULTISPECIES: lysophospholipid acyltransferase family protein [Acidithiobacillus]
MIRRRRQAPTLIPYPGRVRRRSRPQAYRRIWRLPLLLAYLVLAFPLAWWTYARKTEPDNQGFAAFRWWSRRVLGIFGIRLRVEGEIPRAPVLVAANHVSYLDILALASVAPGQFVAKREMRSWPFFGFMGEWLGTFFIDRQDARASQRVLKEATKVLERGRIVLIFPEGTTSDGKIVREFYGAPFETAAAAGVPTVPVALRYEDTLRPGQPDRLCPFVGDDSLLRHLWRLAAAAPLTLRLTFCPPLAADLGRRQLASKTHAAISEALRRMEQGASVTYLSSSRGLSRRHPLRDAWNSWRRGHGA